MQTQDMLSEANNFALVTYNEQTRLLSLIWTRGISPRMCDLSRPELSPIFPHGPWDPRAAQDEPPLAPKISASSSSIQEANLHSKPKISLVFHFNTQAINSISINAFWLIFIKIAGSTFILILIRQTEIC
ncbi:hypothetical protein CDL15_Pgr009134 [Punica granatum]|uniref:Uncharacterized protein n=1 Tax=Punica granatum TaxID=22663 RepID=A0A218WIM8_PUNGR|nr:hypothetical protein CDL15_Pgr009134 [Punica granatum]